MITSSTQSGPAGTQFPNPASSTSSPAAAAGGYNLKPADFIKMMVTQLQNQDPMEPAKNEQLLAQMSQIGQLQSSTDLQTTMKSMTLQSQIGSASSLIGKNIQGLDANNNPIEGVVNSVKVDGGTVNLQLDSGMSMALNQVVSIGNSPVVTTPH